MAVFPCLPISRALVPAIALTLFFAMGELGGQVTSAPAPLTFVDVGQAGGVDFVHTMGYSARKHLPETMGSGVVWLDFDQDGAWDLYFVDSGFLGDSSGIEAQAAAGRPVMHNVLYRGRGDGTFDRAGAAGASDPGFGQGASAGDYDGDGWIDLFVTNYGANTLYRNNGDGTFSDVTAAAGVGDSGWGVSSSWGDLDGDGLPELYVVNYLVYDLEDAPYCRDQATGLLSYCHVDLFEGQRDVLYHNRGDGTFSDITNDAGVAHAGPIEGKGLGVVMGDIDEDGHVDVYVANDMTRNFLFQNRGDLTFADSGLAAGVGFSYEGMPQAGMGVDLGDIDGDGHLDIVVTNFDSQSNNLYRTHGPGFFLDDAYTVGIGESSFRQLGFGVAMIDLDGDGDFDLPVANGHILEVIEQLKANITYEQPNQVFRNRLNELRDEALASGELAAMELAESKVGAARFGLGVAAGEPGWRPQGVLLADVSPTAGQALLRERVSRGLAFADIEGDGWPDLAISNSDGPGEVLQNTTARASQRLVLRFRGRHTNREAFGTRVWVTPLSGDGGDVDFTQSFEVKSSSSYCSQNATDLYVGMGQASTANVEIRWPGGEIERFDAVAAGQLVLIIQGRGLVASVPLRSP